MEHSPGRRLISSSGVATPIRSKKSSTKASMTRAFRFLIFLNVVVLYSYKLQRETFLCSEAIRARDIIYRKTAICIICYLFVFPFLLGFCTHGKKDNDVDHYTDAIYKEKYCLCVL